MQKRPKPWWSMYRDEQRPAGHHPKTFTASTEVAPGRRLLAAAETSWLIRLGHGAALDFDVATRHVCPGHVARPSRCAGNTAGLLRTTRRPLTPAPHEAHGGRGPQMADGS